MKNFTRRNLLLSGAAFTTLAACGSGADVPETAAPSGVVESSEPQAAFDYAKYFDGVSRGGGLANGELTPELLVNDAIARAKAVNPALNAIVNDLYDDARELSRSTNGDGFTGQPTFIKDLDDWKGAPTWYGSRALKDSAPASGYGDFVGTWHKAGMLALGKSTTPEVGLISSTEPLVTGPTRNPWNTDRIPGGSSGGAAALVAARVVPFAHASDGGGSIRIPAACCGLFGLKPSRGALVESNPSNKGTDISVNHAVTLSVRDSIKLFSIAQNNRRDLMDNLAAAPIDRRLKIAFLRDPITSASLDDATSKGIDSAAQLCRDLGHDVFEWTMPVNGDEFLESFLLLWSAGAAGFAQRRAQAAGVEPTLENLASLVEPWTIGLGGNYLRNIGKFSDAVDNLNAFVPLYDSWFDAFDVILSPTVSTVAPEVGYQDPAGDFETILPRVLDFACFTSPMNVSGAASMSVPLAWSEDGMPVGAMFSGKMGDDALLFRLALELEAAQPWINRTPPVNAEA